MLTKDLNASEQHSPGRTFLLVATTQILSVQRIFGFRPSPWASQSHRSTSSQHAAPLIVNGTGSSLVVV
jgi:hypothetical protein